MSFYIPILIVVDDGGSPETSAELECMSRQYPIVIIVGTGTAIG